MAIGEKESKQIKQNTSRDDGVCVCVCTPGGLFQGFGRRSGWWLRPPPGRRWLGEQPRGCRGLVRPVPGRFGRAGGAGLAWWVFSSIPGPLPASLSHLLNPAHLGVSSGFGSGGGCREGRRCPNPGTAAFVWLRFGFAPGVAQPGALQCPQWVHADIYSSLCQPGRARGWEGKPCGFVNPVIKPRDCQDSVSSPGLVSSPAGWVWCGAARLQLPTRAASPSRAGCGRGHLPSFLPKSQLLASSPPFPSSVGSAGLCPRSRSSWQGACPGPRVAGRCLPRARSPPLRAAPQG